MTAPALTYPTSPCKACNAPVIWCVTMANRRAQPLDLEPTSGGRIRIDAHGSFLLAVVVPKAEAQGRSDLRRPHHATCPYADWYRRRKGRAS